MQVKLADEVRVQKMVEVQEKPTLYASKCDGCDKVFVMDEFCNEGRRGELRGTFERVATDEDGRGMGNGFMANVCSFKCAHEVFANGGWRKIPEYRRFADADITLGRAELTLTRYVQGEREIRRRWDSNEDTTQEGHRFKVIGGQSTSGDFTELLDNV
jgi:hypothetical protein